MDPAAVGGLFGVLGTLLGGCIGLVGASQQRKHDAALREADRVSAGQARKEDREERLTLHWLDRKHQIYAPFLSRMKTLQTAIDARWSQGNMRSFVDDGATKWVEEPYPKEMQTHAQAAFDELVLVASAPVAQAAFDYLVHVSHWVDNKRSYVHHAHNRDQGPAASESWRVRHRGLDDQV